MLKLCTYLGHPLTTTLFSSALPPSQPFGPKPFRLETMWFNDPTFPTIIQNSQNSHPYNITAAMQDFIDRVKTWNSNTFDNIFLRKKRLLARLNGIQKSICQNHSTFPVNLKKELLTGYHHILHLEEEFWALKSRIEWTLLED